MERKTYQTLTLIVSLWVLLTGCTYNPLSSNNHLTGSGTATLVGAGLGAGSVALLGAPRPLIVLAGIGGGALGYYVTTLRFESAGVMRVGGNVYTLGDYVTIEIPSDQLFDPNSTELLPEAEPILNSAITVLQRYPNHNILISGNTSGTGPARYEQALSEEQARQVAAYFWAHDASLTNRCAYDSPRQLTYVGYGNYFPIANNIRAKSIRQNSRIQITAYPARTPLPANECGKVYKPCATPKEEPCAPAQPPKYDFSKEFPVESPKPRVDYKAAKMDYKATVPMPIYKPRPNLKAEALPPPTAFKDEKLKPLFQSSPNQKRRHG